MISYKVLGVYTRSMETVYLSLVHTGSWGTFFMKSPGSHILCLTLKSKNCQYFDLQKHFSIAFCYNIWKSKPFCFTWKIVFDKAYVPQKSVIPSQFSLYWYAWIYSSLSYNVCTIYTTYLSPLYTQSADPNPFRSTRCSWGNHFQ